MEALEFRVIELGLVFRIILICNLVIHTTKNYSIIKVFLLFLFSPNFLTRGFNGNRT